MIDQDKQHKFPVYLLPAEMVELQEVVRWKLARLDKLKRPSKRQRAQLERLRVVDKELATTWGDAEPVS